QQRVIPPSTLGNNWIRLRSDGVVNEETDFVATGGVLRDYNGRWILGYNRYLGFCFVMKVELWGILDGLVLLLEQKYDSEMVQTDSMEAALAIQNQAHNDLDSTLIKRIHQNLSRVRH
ncbi:hypothetical protein Godav_020574, partial [Gossypium davidsonii]|nr:hypothetical protein [Gossypium davidsonii]